MEFGDPPLYAELNRAARDLDMSLIDSLGPMAKVMSEITYAAENFREKDDKI